MSFWQRLFANKGSTPSQSKLADEGVVYLGFTIVATPIKNAGQYQTCGVISKPIAGEIKEYRFIRADRFATLDDAQKMIIIKAQQIINEQGDNIFISSQNT